jgi:type II secretory pathway component PulM
MIASSASIDVLQRLAPRERRVVVAGTTLSLLLLVVMWVVLPFVTRWSASESRLAATRTRYLRTATLVAGTDRLRASLAAARMASAGDGDQLLVGATPALAASALQGLVQRDAGASHVQLERVDAAGEPHAARPGLLAIPIQLQARGDLYGLVDFLGRLQHGAPMLVVDELTIDGGLDPGDVDAAPTGVTRPSARQPLTWSIRMHGLYDSAAVAE